ncbi:molybdenum cofactor guanylyltransferase MobA [Acidiferrobacter sp.]|uniref:molybdenum cofactor guanylyltransferase MobA n=1 Tax=Acidiferrobacter sp. TaxID=1872107 RepID=UPI00260BEC2F|nr:molybdenum cofactor guanylyltransferase MobA [Acidiferrobacter sp.]
MGQGVLPITGVVLAGGAGRRMGGQDKGFALWSGEPLIENALKRLAGLPQVLISANRSLARYRALGYEVVTDECPDFAGPLEGLRAAFRHAAQSWLLSVPVDTPCLPPDLVLRLWHLRIANGLVVARSPRGPEPLVCLADTRLRAHLEAYWQAGGRRAQEWFAGADVAWLDLTAAQAANCNTPEDLR